MIKIAKNENNEDNNVIKDKAKQVGGKIIKTVGFTALKFILPVVLIVILLAGMIWFIFDDLGTWGKEEKGRPNIYTQNVKMDPKEGIIIDRDGLIKQVLLDYGYTEEEISELTEQEIIDKLLLSKKLKRTINSLDDCTNAEILWCLSEDYSKFIKSPEKLEYLLNAELVTQYPYIDGLDESKTNGVIKFYRYSNTGDVDFKSGYANAGEENQEEVVEEEEDSDDSAETIDASKIFYIGDSWMNGLQGYGHVSSEYTYAEDGAVQGGTGRLKQKLFTGDEIVKNIKSDSSAIVIMLGLNRTDKISEMKSVIDAISSSYTDKTLYVLKVFHVGKGYSGADKMNLSIDNFNNEISNYCATKSNVSFIDTTTGLYDSEGYLSDTYSDSSNYHLKNPDGYLKWFYNIEQAVKASGSLRNNVTSQEVYRIKYTSEENFDSLFAEYENSGKRDVFKYFTMDSEGNVIVATWTKTTGTFTTKNGNKSIGEIQSLYDTRYQQTASGVGFVEYTAAKTKINYKSMAAKYTIPFEYLWALLVEGEDYEFVERISNLAYNTEFNIGIYDSVTTSTNVDKNYYTRVVTKTTTSTNKATGEVEENKTSKSIQCVDISTIVTETDSITYDVAYANTWIVEIWTKYIAKNFNEAEEKDVTIMENQKGNLSEQDVIERLEKLEEEEDKEEWVNTTEGEELLINSANREETVNTDTEEYDNLQVTEQSSVSNAYEYTEPEIKEKIDVDPNTGDNFVKALRESENAYRLLTNSGTIEWLCEVLENNEDTANMVDLTRALITKAKNPDAEIDFDFSIFKPENFQSFYNGIYGNTIEEKLWFALKNMNYTDIAVAGALGNFQVESGFKANNLENGFEKKLGFTDESYTEAVDNGSYSLQSFMYDQNGKDLRCRIWYCTMVLLY